MKAPSYFDHNSRRTDDVPLEVIDWVDPPTQPMDVEERDLTEREWLEFKRILAGLK